MEGVEAVQEDLVPWVPVKVESAMDESPSEPVAPPTDEELESWGLQRLASTRNNPPGGKDFRWARRKIERLKKKGQWSLKRIRKLYVAEE